MKIKISFLRYSVLYKFLYISFAVAGRDYVPLSTVISFEKEEFIAKARVRVINNQVLQQKRMFSAMIEVTSGLKFPAQVIDAVVNIEIEDDDSECDLLFCFIML